MSYSDKLKLETSLTFDDVLIEPAESWIEPNDAEVSSKFSKNIPLSIPLVSAAMDTVTESAMAVAMARAGGIGVLHRNCTAEEEVNFVERVKNADNVIERDVRYVTLDTTISYIANLMERYSISGVPVVGPKGKLVGIVSRRDVRGVVDNYGNDTVDKIMTKRPICVKDDITADEAIHMMYTKKVERLPVVDDKKRLTGIITMQDLLEKQQYPNANKDSFGRLRVAAAVGPFDQNRAEMLAEAGVDAIVVDCAHGHNMHVVEGVKNIKSILSCDVIAGNIATKEAASVLVDTVDGIKVGIGPGSICTTRIVAGVGVPQITAIANVCDAAHDADVPVIADGGVKFSGDVAKAIAAGASSVMMGSMFAGTDEAPGKTTIVKGRRYKQYRGMGSLGVMTSGNSSDRYFQKKGIGATKYVPEGVEGATPYVGSVNDVIYQTIGGLKSAMGYSGCRNISEMQTKAKFVRITASGLKESHPHDILITDEAPNYRTRL
ncbi:MAG TPA: IMP dehydrogenase [Methanocorpusculum sp.]|nr:IMP dehydrogenase [Methanocorpusculum sp.]